MDEARTHQASHVYTARACREAFAAKHEVRSPSTSLFRRLVVARVCGAGTYVRETRGVPFVRGAGYRFEVAGISQIPIYVYFSFERRLRFHQLTASEPSVLVKTSIGPDRARASSAYERQRLPQLDTL